MAWKIRRKAKRDGLSILHEEQDGVMARTGSIDDIAAFMASKAEPFCATCGGENDLLMVGNCGMWGCPLCDAEEQESNGSGNN